MADLFLGLSSSRGAVAGLAWKRLAFYEQGHWQASQTKSVADENESFEDRLSQMAESYLSKTHRDQKEFCCAIAALASEVCKANESFKQRYANTIEQTVNDIALDDENQMDESMLFLAPMTGAINLARNTKKQARGAHPNVCRERYSR